MDYWEEQQQIAEERRKRDEEYSRKQQEEQQRRDEEYRRQQEDQRKRDEEYRQQQEERRKKDEEYRQQQEEKLNNQRRQDFHDYLDEKKKRAEEEEEERRKNDFNLLAVMLGTKLIKDSENQHKKEEEEQRKRAEEKKKMIESQPTSTNVIFAGSNNYGNGNGNTNDSNQGPKDPPSTGDSLIPRLLIGCFITDLIMWSSYALILRPFFKVYEIGTIFLFLTIFLLFGLFFSQEGCRSLNNIILKLGIVFVSGYAYWHIATTGDELGVNLILYSGILMDNGILHGFVLFIVIPLLLIYSSFLMATTNCENT